MRTTIDLKCNDEDFKISNMEYTHLEQTLNINLDIGEVSVGVSLTMFQVQEMVDLLNRMRLIKVD